MDVNPSTPSAPEPVLLPEPEVLPAEGRGRLGALSRLAPEPMKVILNWGRRYSLWVFNFGLACCAIEFIAASMARHDFIRLGVIPFAPGPRQADLMVVSGRSRQTRWPRPSNVCMSRCPSRSTSSPSAPARTAVAPTGTRTRSPRASTRSSRWTSTYPAARRVPRHCSRASSNSRRRSRASRWGSGTARRGRPRQPCRAAWSSRRPRRRPQGAGSGRGTGPGVAR